MNHSTIPVKVGSQVFGGKNFQVIAGPCAVESLEQFLTTAKAVRASGAVGLRGGLFKLRTDPKSFQGLGPDAFEIAKIVRAETDMPFFSEITDPRQISEFMDVVDAFQVGSRNMHNYSLLKELGQTRKPILLKRGLSALFKEWMLAAEYIVKGGNEQIILCERGIRTFETSTRNTFDVNAIALAKQSCPFPILADPSHGTGNAKLVPAVALAAVAAGADGLLIEVHPDPSKALSDGYQSLNLKQFDDLMKKIRRVSIALQNPDLLAPVLAPELSL
jgi:3-deoxy-7-phosphoheptulonate synthase